MFRKTFNVLLEAIVITSLLGGASVALAKERDMAAFDLQGHRGARGLMPENTLPAFIHAFELGVTTLELDVVLTRDNEVVVSHEPWFSAEICSHPDGRPVTEDEQHGLNIFTMNYAEAASFDCGSRGNPRFPGQAAMKVSKPLLREVLTIIEAHEVASRPTPIRYNIEIKSRPSRDRLNYNSIEEYAQSLYDVLTSHGVLARTAVQSFDPRSLEAMKRIDPGVELVLLVDNTDGFSENLGHLSFKPEIYSPNFELVDRALVDQAHELGIRVIPWTVNDEDRMRELISMGIDGLITDYPGRAQAVLSGDSDQSLPE